LGVFGGFTGSPAATSVGGTLAVTPAVVGSTGATGGCTTTDGRRCTLWRAASDGRTSRLVSSCPGSLKTTRTRGPVDTRSRVNGVVPQISPVSATTDAPGGSESNATRLTGAGGGASTRWPRSCVA
jgi:hypothetical protein